MLGGSWDDCRDLGCERYLVRVVGGGPGALHAVGGHDGPQVVTLHQELVLLLPALLIDVDDSSGHLRDALHHHLDSETQRARDPAVGTASPPSSQKPQWLRGLGVSQPGCVVVITPSLRGDCQERAKAGTVRYLSRCGWGAGEAEAQGVVPFSTTSFMREQRKAE